MDLFDNITVGVLALQGDYACHADHVRRVGAHLQEVRLPQDLEPCDALIMPGGESTTMSLLLDRFSLREPLRAFLRSKPTYGTCAGLILLGSEIEDNQSGVIPLKALDISVVRNGYGRQVFSFHEHIEVQFNGERHTVAVDFIRAPRITRVGKGVEVLSRLHSDPILVRQGKTLAGSFHAELGSDTAVLRFFLDKFLPA